MKKYLFSVSGSILANLVIGSNGATSISGSSRGLSFPEDRLRFHGLRKAAKAIAIGGATYRAEPYKNPILPLYISSNGASDFGEGIQAFEIAPKDLVARALAETGGPVLIEGGVNFLCDLLREGLVDLLYVTRSPKAGNGDFVPSDFFKSYELTQSEEIGDGIFEIWRPTKR